MKIRRRLTRLGLPLVMLMAVTSAARAQQAAPTPFLRLSIASVDSINKLMSDLAIPPMDIKGMVEANNPVLKPEVAKDAIAGNRPLGVVMLAGGGLNLAGPSAENAVVLAIPVSEGKLTIDNLKEAGAKEIEGSKEMVTMDSPVIPGNELTLRRTPSYLFLQPMKPIGLADMADNPFAGDYKAAGNVAVLSFNMTAFKAGAPELYKEFVENAKGAPMPAPGGAAEAAGQRFGRDAMLAAIDKLEKLTLAIAEDDKGLHLRNWIAPVAAKAPNPMPRPVFGPDTIFQLHIVYPEGWSDWPAGIVDNLPADAFEKLTPEQVTSMRGVIKRATKVFVGGDAFSMAVSMKEGKPVVSLVNQLNGDLNAADELKAILADAATLQKAMGDTSPAPEASTYDAGGKTVTRLKDTDGTCVDMLQVGKVVYFTISPTDAKYVADLAALGMKGQNTIFLAGVLDLDQAFKAASEGGAPLPPQTIQDLKAAAAGQGITITSQTGDNFLYTDLSVPLPVVKAVSKMIQGLVGGPPPAAETTTPPGGMPPPQ